MAQKTVREAWGELDRKVEDFAVEVHPVFVKNGWTWRGSKNAPSKIDIEITLRGLVWDAYREIEKSNTEHTCVGTGRLQVRFNRYQSGWMGSLELVPLHLRS